MASGLDTLTWGGRINTVTGMLLTSVDVNRAGSIALQSICNFAALLFHDELYNVPRTGFPMGQETGDHCLVTADGALGFDISSGVGWLYNASATPDAYGPATYRPIVVAAEYQAGTLEAHDSQPRIDLVCLAPAWEDNEPEDRQVKDPLNPGDPAAETEVDVRRQFSYALQVVKGTPAATPVAPSVPAGYVEIARALVPATSGNATWTDTRPPLVLSNALLDAPYHGISTEGYVIGANVSVPLGAGGYDVDTALQVTASSPASMVLQVAKGRLVLRGRTRKHNGGTVTITTAPVANNRIDLVYVNSLGELTVKAGTVAATPVAPVMTAQHGTPLATVYVGTGVTTIDADDITDVRQFGPVGTRQLHDQAVTRAKIADEAVGTDQVEEGGLQLDRLGTTTVKVKLGSDLLPPSISGDVATFSLSAPWLDTLATQGEAVPMVAEVFVHDPSTSSAGEYGFVGASDLDKLPAVPATTAPDVAFAIGAGGVLTSGLGQVGDLQSPRMFFTKNADAGAPVVITLRRRTSSVTGKYIVQVSPVGHLGVPYVAMVEFT